MATARPEIPTIDDLLDAVLDRLPVEVVASLAAMREPRGRATLADQIVITAWAKARDRGDQCLPLPDEPDFNEETRRTIEDARAGKGLTEYESLDDFLAAMDLESQGTEPTVPIATPSSRPRRKRAPIRGV